MMSADPVATPGVSGTGWPQRPDELCVTTLRALSAEPDLHLRGGRWYRGRLRLPLHAPHLLPSAGDDLGSLRGASDGVALRLIRSDDLLNRRMRPEEPLARLIFEMLEQFRVEALVPATLPGVARNLRRRHEQWSLSMHHGGLTETARGLLLYTVVQVCRAQISGQPVVAGTEDLIEATRAAIAADLGTYLRALRCNRADQAAFARPARALADRVAAMLQTAPGDRGAGGARQDAADDRFALLASLEDTPGESGQAVGAADGDGRPGRHRSGGYRVFTAAYDQERHITSLVRAELLADYRKRLDESVARQGINLTRVVRDLTALLASPARAGWDGAQEEGRIDGRALAQLVTSPAERRLFRQERTELSADVLVTFLIDCSGSMAAHREPVAVLADVFARALELAGAGSEILGFTTGAWHGGRALRDWQRAGQPAHPGRLSEVSHLVFKSATTPWRRSRRHIAGMLKADLFREGVDGEAVTWAAHRARSHDARRRLLIVLSDGSPMDRATVLANGENYLDQHLAEVVADLEDAGDVEIYGVGVGLDLSPYYQRCRVLGTVGDRGYRVFGEILGLIARPGR
jgi:cobaltochelatase CobT